MKTIKSALTIFSGVLVGILISCSGLDEIKVTYTKAIAIYGDIDAIRNTSLVAPSRSIENAGKIFLQDDLLLIGEEGEGIHVFDNSNPEAPSSTLFMTIPGNKEFFLSGHYLYAESLYDMLKIDLSNPGNPTIEARINNAFGTELYNNSGQVAISFAYEQVTEEIDINDDIYNYIANNENYAYFDYAERLIPASAVPASFSGNSVGQIGSVNRITAKDGYVYTVSRAYLGVYEMVPFNQVYNEYVQWNGNMETVYPFGDRLFIGTNNSVEVFNVEDPANPWYESSFWHATSCDPVLPVSEETAYATLRTGDFAECPGDINALVVLDVSMEDWWIEQIQEIPMESPYGLTKVENKLYVGEGENGLKVFDATVEQNLQLIKHDRTVKAYDVLPHPSDENIMLIAGPEGLIQYKLKEDDNFEELSAIAF